MKQRGFLNNRKPISFFELVREDASCRHLKWRGFYTIVWAALFHREMYCIFLYRLNRIISLKGYHRLSNFLQNSRQRKFGNEISPEADIATGIVLGHITGVIIGKGVVIGKNARIQQHVTIGTKYFTPHPRIDEPANEDPGVPCIGDNVSIGTGAVIVGKIFIGANVTIGALSFVNCDVPSNSVVYGTPPNRIVRTTQGSVFSPVTEHRTHA